MARQGRSGMTLECFARFAVATVRTFITGLWYLLVALGIATLLGVCSDLIWIAASYGWRAVG